MHANEPTRFAETAKRQRSRQQERADREAARRENPGSQALANGIAGSIQSGRRFAGRYWIGSELATSKRVRDDIQRWASLMLPHRFGTLTLRTKHGSTCRRESCDGNQAKGANDCHVPGVQATEIAVVKWLGLVESGLVVEEVGSDTKRRHFHHLSVGTGIPNLQFLQRGKCRTHCYKNGPNRYWEQYFGHVDESEVKNQAAVIAYVTKYAVKAQGELDDGYGTIARWWWKWGEQQWGWNGTGDDENAVPGPVR